MPDPRTIAQRRSEIGVHMTRLRCAYPTQKFTETPWEAVLLEWEHELVRYPSLVLERAFDQVLRRGEGAKFFPSLPEVIAICNLEDERHLRELADERRGHLLPPAPSSRAEALRDFLAAADKATKEPTGEWSDANVPIVEGVLACLCPVFGVSPLVATGKQPDRHGAKFNFVRGVVASWRRMKIASPAGVIHALKDVPEHFSRFPTEGLLRDLITGDLTPERIPPDFRKHQPPVEAPAQEQ